MLFAFGDHGITSQYTDNRLTVMNLFLIRWKLLVPKPRLTFKWETQGPKL